MSVAAFIRACLRGFPRRLGTPGILGLIVLLACAAFYASALRPAERELAVLREAPRVAASRQLQPAAIDNRNGALRRFHALFPSAENLADQVESLFALARTAGLQLSQGEYRIERQPRGLLAYRVVLPVRGNYAQIRSFAGEVLNGMPFASLDAVRFERKKSAEAQLEAQLRITIYFRSPEETP